MAPLVGIEPTTQGLEDPCSIPMSYRDMGFLVGIEPTFLSS